MRAQYWPALSLVASLAFQTVVLETTAIGQTSQPAAGATQPAAPLTFSLTYDPSITDSFTGRVYVMLSTHSMGDPRFGPSWFSKEPFFGRDVTDWTPRQALVFDDRADAFPGPMSTVVEKTYSIQAVMRRNLDSPSVGDAEGDAFSAVLRQTVNGLTSGDIALHIDQVVGPPSPDSRRTFRETDRIKLVEVRSSLLSEFHRRDITMRAAVILPKGHEKEPNRRYPALYWIGGFGSDHRAALMMNGAWERSGMSDRIIRIVPDPQCFGGHHVFADSDNNGPRGRALTEEFIPYLESKFPIVPDANSRFLSGHSSGGWSSLWLQVAYPEVFGGTWSVAPDPVDFRDFQRINLYTAGANMYLDEKGERRPLARFGEKPVLWYDTFAQMDAVIGEGGQLRSFEWVFSRRGADGKPEPLYDRTSGAVNPKVAETWKRYDINLILSQNWPTLGPKLSGGEKIHIFMGDVDTFYLDGATKLLKKTLENLSSKALVVIEPGKDHNSIANPALYRRIDEELLAVFEMHHPDQARPRAYD